MQHRSQKRYWNENIKLIRSLLLVWAIVPFGACILFAKPLNSLTIGQIPFGFWLAQQGVLSVFVIIIFVYAHKMDALDQQHQHHDSE